MIGITLAPSIDNGQILEINCGTSTPKLGGIIDLNDFTSLRRFTCINNDIETIAGYELHPSIVTVFIQQNKIIGSIPNLANNINLELFYCDLNLITGSIPSLSANTKLREFRCNGNIMSGPIPNLNNNIALRSFYCSDQKGSTRLSGPIPSLSANTQLVDFYCFGNQLSGPIPSLSANTQLEVFQAGTNQLTDLIPNLSNNTKITTFNCSRNSITGFAGGTVPITLGTFQVQENQLPTSAVNAILAAFVAANRTTGTRVLNIGGTGNAAPTGQGITDRSTLISRGWTVTTN